jgi:hypothetical protein
MLEVLQFIFQDFWHWAGMILLIGAVGAAVGAARGW